MTFVDKVKKKVEDVTETVRDEVAARHEKAESDIESDRHVAGARNGGDAVDGETDGDYVGRTSPAFDPEVEQSGAEARSEAKRLSE